MQQFHSSLCAFFSPNTLCYRHEPECLNAGFPTISFDGMEYPKLKPTRGRRLGLGQWLVVPLLIALGYHSPLLWTLLDDILKPCGDWLTHAEKAAVMILTH